MRLLVLFILLSSAIQAQTAASGKPAVKDSAIMEISSARERCEAIRQKVIAGENMGDLARLYSEDPGSAKNGGLLLNVTRGKMVAPFETVAFSLQPGEISEVFETQYGYHFIQLLEINKEALNLRHILIMQK